MTTLQYRLWVFHGPHQNKFDAALMKAWQPRGIIPAVSQPAPASAPKKNAAAKMRSRRKSVLIDLDQHGSLREDLFDAYVAQQRRAEPRESLATVKRLLQFSARRRGRWIA